MRTMTRIVISLFVAVLILHVAAAIVTSVTVSSGRFVEGNPAAAELQFSYGVPAGLAVTLIEGTILSMVPLFIYLGALTFTRSSYVPACDKQQTMQFVKYCFFPLAVFVLGYLIAIAGADVIHDSAMLLSNGQINPWSF